MKWDCYTARASLKPIRLEARVFDDDKDGGRQVSCAKASWDGREAFHESPPGIPCRPMIALARLLRETLDDDELGAVIAEMQRPRSA